MMGYFITNISFSLLVKEFFKSVYIWQSYNNNDFIIIIDFIGMAANQLDYLQTKYSVNCKRKKSNTKMFNYRVN